MCWTYSKDLINIMTLNIIYLCVLGCIVKLRPDWESSHQAGHFGIYDTSLHDQVNWSYEFAERNTTFRFHQIGHAYGIVNMTYLLSAKLGSVIAVVNKVFCLEEPMEVFCILNTLE